MLKRLFMLVTTIMAFLMIAGCGGNTDQARADRAAKGEIVISMGKSMINGGYDPTSGWGMWAADPFHSALYTRNDKKELEMDLAKDVTISPDGLHYTFKIRDDVKFSDGQPLTAKDIVFTYETAQKAGGYVDLTFMESVVAKDDYTVEFTLKKPWSLFLEITSTLGIVPAHAYNKETYGSQPIGSGPWKVVAFQKEQQLIMEPNEYYYGEKPKLKKVTVLNIAEDAAVAAAKSGQVDVLFLNSDYANAKVDNMKVFTMQTIASFTLNLPTQPEREENGMKVGNNITSDPAIRKALNIGINRAEIIKNALNGFGEPTYMYSKELAWVNPELNITDNRVEEAKKILEDAGWKDTDGDGIREKNGVKAEFKISGRSNDLQRYNTAVALAADAKKLGINMIAESMAWSDARKIARNVPTIWGIGDFNPLPLYMYFHSSQIGKNVINNPAMYSNPTVDAHIDAALAATNWDEAIKEFKLAQWDGKTGIKEDVPYLWIANVSVPYLVRDGLDLGNVGVNERGQGMGIIANLSQWQWK